MSGAAHKLTAYQQEQTAITLATVRARLMETDPEIAQDETLMRDMLDGESDGVDFIRALLRASLDAAAMVEGAENRIRDIQERKARFERRKEALRSAAFALMDVAGIKNLTEPDLQAVLAAPRDKLGPLDEDMLPDEYVTVKIERVAQKAKILADLKAGKEIPGASLANGMPVLQVRTR